jgi:hypothetical protein
MIKQYHQNVAYYCAWNCNVILQEPSSASNNLHIKQVEEPHNLHIHRLKLQI